MRFPEVLGCRRDAVLGGAELRDGGVDAGLRDGDLIVLRAGLLRGARDRGTRLRDAAPALLLLGDDLIARERERR